RAERAAADLATTRAELEEARAQLAETRAEAEAAGTERTDLERQLTEALAAVVAAQSAEDELGRRLAAALAEQRQVEADAAETRERLAAALAAQRSAEAEVEDLRSRLEDAAAARLAAEQGQGERDQLLAVANRELEEQRAAATEAQRQTALLNQQVRELSRQLARLQGLIDASREADAAQQVRIESLGAELNAALARAAAEERRRRQLEEERARLLEAEKEDLERYRSEFFGRLRAILGAQQGVQIEGDRFVFPSEVLFAPGQAELSREGRAEIGQVAEILKGVMNRIPDEIDWVLRVDGHTDNVPLIASAEFEDNWELSQARALSVVRYLIDAHDIPPERLSANGFGEYQPIDPRDTAEARARNRRIELKLTER
ncbi:MAG: peptidoglycan -binding protein, partial [Rhodosalinus sp.]